MKIGLNGQMLLIGKPAGPEKYTYHLFNSLAKIDHENEYVIYFARKPHDGYFERLTAGNEKFKCKVIKKLGSWTQISLALELLQHPPDVFFSAIHTVPGFATLVLQHKTKFITMIHGLEYKTNQQYATKPLLKLIHPLILWWVLKFSTAIITPSHATKDAILKSHETFLDKISVIYEGVDESFCKQSAKEIAQIQQKYSITSDKYLFFLSTIQPRKNVVRMIEAFSLVLKERPGLSLIIAGKNGWDYEAALAAPKKYGCEDAVKFIGRIADNERAPLLSGAVAYINVSLEEGFGLPLLEALACETPVVASDIAAFKEVADNLPVYVDPKDIQSIKNGIKKILKIEKTNEAGVKLKNRSALFTWESTAKQILEVFNSSFSQKQIRNLFDL